MSKEPLVVGVIGVGVMGSHHARVYNEIPGVDLVGVTDVDSEVAAEVAADHDTEAFERDELLERVDAVSVVVPTQFHYDIAIECFDHGVATLIEKPLVRDLELGRDLRKRAEEAGVTVQVGHIERFNPVVETLETVLADLDVIAVTAERLGPPSGRSITDTAVLDLMIHDLDIVMQLLDADPDTVESAGVQSNTHATALIEFDEGTLATFTASRLTQQKIRTLEITAEECYVEVDYIDQSIEIHRQSIPEYIQESGGMRYRHESIVERPTVSHGEPLRRELDSFVDTVRINETPAVTIDDALKAINLAQVIEDRADKQGCDR